MFLNKKKEKNKISDMIITCAGDFTLEGENEFEKQQRLNTVVSAWNFACLNDSDRERGIKTYLKECKKLNPKYSKKNLKEIEKVLKKIIAAKIRIYPNIKAQIVNANLKEDSGKTYLTVASVDTK